MPQSHGAADRFAAFAAFLLDNTQAVGGSRSSCNSSRRICVRICGQSSVGRKIEKGKHRCRLFFNLFLTRCCAKFVQLVSHPVLCKICSTCFSPVVVQNVCVCAMKNGSILPQLALGRCDVVLLPQDNDLAYAIDASVCGSIARFVEPVCSDGNLCCTFVSASLPSALPRVAFFARRRIRAQEVLSVSVPRMVDGMDPRYALTCRCGKLTCKMILTWHWKMQEKKK